MKSKKPNNCVSIITTIKVDPDKLPPAVKLYREKIEREARNKKIYGYLSRLDDEIVVCAKMLKDRYVNKDILLKVRIRYVDLLERRQDEYTRILKALNNQSLRRVI